MSGDLMLNVLLKQAYTFAAEDELKMNSSQGGCSLIGNLIKLTRVARAKRMDAAVNLYRKVKRFYIINLITQGSTLTV